MTDVTLLAMEADNPGVADDESRWRRGEVVDVFPLEQCPGPAGHPRHLHIHITGVPFTLEQVKRALTKRHSGDPALELLDQGIIARRRFCINAADIPINARNQLVTNREITVTWNQVKSYIRRRLAGARTLDTNLTDADIG